MNDLTINGKYKIGNKIGSGAFGEIYLGTNIETKEHYAIKLENVNTKYAQLQYEYKVYKYLNGKEGVPKIYWFGTEGEYNLMVMEFLGNSLEELFASSNRRFSLKTIVLIGIQMINLIRFVHSKYFIHRDIKPDNFLIGHGRNSNLLHIIDFGLSKRFIDSKTLEHNKMTNNKSLTGTARYASINAHGGFEQSRRDDCESIFYVLLYFSRPGLPWQGVDAKTKEEKFAKIMEMKKITPLEELCKNSPKEFHEALKYIKNMQFEEEPNYNWLISLMINVFKKNNFIDDGKFDWNGSAEEDKDKNSDPFKSLMKRKSSKLNKLNFEQKLGRKNNPREKLVRIGMST